MSFAEKNVGYDGSSPPRGDNHKEVQIFTDRQLRKGNFETNFPQPVDVKRYRQYLLRVATECYSKSLISQQINKIVDAALAGFKSGKYEDQVGNYHNDVYVKVALEIERSEISFSDATDNAYR